MILQRLRTIFFISIFAFIGPLLFAHAVHAEDVDVTVTSTSTTEGGTANWTIEFTAPADIASGESVSFFMPADWSNWPATYFDASDATVSSANGSFTVDEWGTLSFTFSTNYTSGDSVTIGLNGIVNVSKAGTYELSGYFYGSNYSYYYLRSNSIIVGTVALQGSVVNSASVGVSNVYVNVYCSDTGDYAWTSTDSSGAFSISGAEGSCTVSFSYWGDSGSEAPASETLTLPYSGTKTFQMLTPNVSTTLTLPDGTTPVSGAWGWVYSADWQFYKWFTTSDAGVVSFAVSDSDTYYMEFDIQGTQYSGSYHAPSKITFTYNANTQSVSGLSNPILLTTPNVTASIQKPDGSAAPDYTYVYVYDSSYSVFEWGWTSNGVVSYAVNPGSYTIQVDWIGYDVLDPTAQWIAPASETFTAPATDIVMTLETANNTIRAVTKGVSSSSNEGSDEGKGEGSDEGDFGGDFGNEEGDGGTKGGDGGKGMMSQSDAVGIQAYYYGWTNDGKRYFYGQTDADGVMSQKVGSGKYNIFFDTYEFPKQNYFTQTHIAKFDENDGSTEDLGDVVADAADATINVSVTSATSCGGGLLSGGGVSIFSDHVWQWSNLSSGVATVMVPAGTYRVSVFAYGLDCDQASPESPRVTIASEGEEDVDITMVARDATLQGSVSDSDGAGLGCQYVWGWRQDYGDWFNAQTEQDGTWSTTVTEGTWNIMSYPSGIASTNCSNSSSSDSGMMPAARYVSGGPMGGTSSDGNGTGVTYVSLEGTQTKSVVSNATVSGINFTYAVADATISGFVYYDDGVDTNAQATSEGEDIQAGDVASNVNGFVTIGSANGGREADFYSNSLWGWISNSQFEIKVPASPEGGYELSSFMDLFSDYTVVGVGREGSYDQQSIDIDSGETVSDAAIYVLPNDATITGTIDLPEEAAGTEAEVCADNGNGGFVCTTADSDGSYNLNVASGEWTVTSNIDESYGLYEVPTTENTVDVESQGEESVNLEYVAADAIIDGTLTDSQGDVIAGAEVVASSDEFTISTTTNPDGSYTLNVPGNESYLVSVGLPDDVDDITPAFDEVTVESDGTETIDMAARASDATIMGSMSLNDDVVEGFVGAYSSDGAYVWSEVGADGTYSLPVFSGEEWTVFGYYDDDDTGIAYNSGFVSMNVDGSTESSNFDFDTQGQQSVISRSAQALRRTASSSSTMSASQRKSWSSSTQQAYTFSDGARFNIPAYSLSSSDQTVTGTITPTTEVPSTSTQHLVSYAYKTAALDSNNAEIGKLTGSASITLPYTDAQLTNLGITEDDITMSVFNGTTWKDVSSAVVSKSSNTITANVTRFGTFAVTTSSRSAASSEVGSDLGVPQNLRVKKNSRAARSFTMRWAAVEDATEYVVEVWNARTSKLLKSYTTSATQKKVTKRKGNTKYTIRVRAESNSAIGDFSDVVAVRTLPSEPTKMSITSKTINDNGTGSFRLRFTQKGNRKNLRAIVNVLNEDDSKISFGMGSKDFSTKQKFDIRSAGKLQHKTFVVSSDDVGMPLRVSIQIQNTKKPKKNMTEAVQSNLFTIL